MHLKEKCIALKRKYTEMTKDIAVLGKCLLLSKPASRAGEAKDRALVVMGNGPSLREVMSEHRQWLMSHDRLAVNFAAIAPEFKDLAPQIYVLADPHFFTGYDRDEKVRTLWQSLSEVTWPMTLYIPNSRRRLLREMTSRHPLPKSVKVKWYNLTPADGADTLMCRLFDLGLAMPRPRNVLIPSVMMGMREGYKRIYLCGADHSWSKTLWVDDDNRVISIQPHFYKDNKAELDRVASEYAGIRLHSIYESFAIAFRAYHHIAAYARRKGVEIINATPGSFIDAFPRSMKYEV